MWRCKECGSSNIGVREDIMKSTTFIVTIGKDGDYKKKKKYGKTGSETFGISYECLDCSNVGESTGDFNGIKNVADWEE